MNLNKRKGRNYMEQRIRNYVNEIFKNAPKTTQAEEVKNEILGNTLEKYNELKAEGKDDETAFTIAISYIGNVDELINAYAHDDDAVILRESYQRHRARQALLLSIAVALYIMCVLPVILTQDEKGIVVMFIMIAVATGLIIYRASTNKFYTYAGSDGPTVVRYTAPQTIDQKKRKLMRKNISSAMWSLIVALYLIISFLTGAWHITWIIFLIGGAADSLLKAVFDYKEWNDLEDDSNEK